MNARPLGTGTSMIDLSAAVRLLLGFPLLPSGVGGSTLLGGFFPCVAQVFGDGMFLGSCAILRGGRVALTASHVVCAARTIRPYAVRASVGTQAGEYHVKRIHWRSGELYDSALQDWPTVVGNYKDELDRLVLLELEINHPLPDRQLAYLPKGRRPAAGDILVAAGFGEDLAGNQQSPAWGGVARAVASVDDAFASYVPRRTDLFCGMPRPGDSGAAVFMPPMSNPAPPRHLRLVGVHSGRRVSPDSDGEVGVYLPIDEAAEEWIARVCAQAGTAPHRAGLPKSPGHEFCHRKYLTCYRFNDPPVEVDGVELILSTKGRNRLLAHDTALRIDLVGKRLRLMLTHPERGRIEVMLNRSRIGGQSSGHWYTNDDGTNDCYYLFLVNDKPKASVGSAGRSPLVHIEAFKAGSKQPRPSICTIGEPGCSSPTPCEGEDAEPMPWDVPEIDGTETVYVQDQDDEGNGHEPPP